MCVCVCIYKREREKKRGRERETDRTNTNLRAHLAKRMWFRLPTWEKCQLLSLHLKLLWRLLGCIKASTSPSPSKILSLREKISFNYWERGFKFISVFRDFLQIAVQGAAVHIKMMLLILTWFPCCNGQTVKKKKKNSDQLPSVEDLWCITKTTACRHTGNM